MRQAVDVLWHISCLSVTFIRDLNFDKVIPNWGDSFITTLKPDFMILARTKLCPTADVTPRSQGLINFLAKIMSSNCHKIKYCHSEPCIIGSFSSLDHQVRQMSERKFQFAHRTKNPLSNMFPVEDLRPPSQPVQDVNFEFVVIISTVLSFLLLVLVTSSVYFFFLRTGSQDVPPFQHSPQVPKSLQPTSTVSEDYSGKLCSQFYERNPWQVNALGKSHDERMVLLVKDRGISSYEFSSFQDQTQDLLSPTETSPLLSRQQGGIPYYVEDRLDVTFTTSMASSALLNFPIPTRQRHNDTTYFEAKIFDLDRDSKVYIGLCARPFANFKLPGTLPYSIAVDSDGFLHINDSENNSSSVVLPQLYKGDILGFGYKSSKGSIFVTHNGKKITEIIKGLKYELTPCVGSVGGPAKVSVNVGQLGFIYIEGNVKKLGFCEGKNEGELGAPPLYKKENKDVLLDQGDKLPPKYPLEEETFFGPASMRIKRPPSYHSDEKSSSSNEDEVPDSVVSMNERLYEQKSSLFHRYENATEGSSRDLYDQRQQTPSTQTSNSRKPKGKKRNNKKKKKNSRRK